MRIRAAIKRAIRDAIRQNCNFKQEECDIVAPPGRPHPVAGKWFVGIWDGSRSWEHSGSVMMRMNFNVTVSMKITAPQDRIGTKELDLSEQQEGLNEVVGRISSMLFAWQWKIAAEVNSNLAAVTASSVNGILEAPRPLNDGPPEECTADWFGGIQPADKWRTNTRGLPAGYRCTINYGGALVAQYISEGTG